MAFLPTPLPPAPRAQARRRLLCMGPPAAALSAKRFSRRVVLAALASAAGSLVAAEVSTAAGEGPSALQYTVVKRGEGPAAVIGDLVGIRFKGTYNGVVFDNLFEETKPYFFRAGSGTILKVG